MRDNEQFKAYVHAKADAVQAKRRKTQRIALGGFAAFCVCVCIGSAVLFSEIDRNAAAEGFMADISACATLAQSDRDEETAYGTPTEADADAAGDASGTEQENALEAGCADSSQTDAPAAVKNYLYSMIACPPSYGLISAAHCEVIENNTEDGDDASPGSGISPVKVGISGNFISKPTISDVTIDYSSEEITITVFADQLPSALGSYLYYFTEPLDANRYTGQPIELSFKLTPVEETNRES